LPICLKNGPLATCPPRPALRTVSVTHPKRSEDSTLSLPANVDAYQTTSLYARVSGYVVAWHADIGDRVVKGKVLADIDTPEMDQDLNQAQANLVQGKADLDTARAELAEAQAALAQTDADIARAKADLEFARSVHRRNEALSLQHAIANQDLEDSLRTKEMRQADLDSANAQLRTRQATVATSTRKITSHEATVKSLEASVRRLEEMQVFKTIVAPFDGIVIRRRAEIGMLITAGGGASAQELFAVTQADTLRIRVNVPQSHARSIEIGQKAQVFVPEYPERVFTAQVARTARAIDPVSRMLMVELELANADHALLPGTFAQVKLATHQASATWSVAAGVLLNRPQGLQVAVVDEQGIVHLRMVTLGRDHGSRVEVLAGLTGNETLIVNPPDDLADSEHVATGSSAVAAQEKAKAR
jgi:RND family efflux transporter MFP subunit